MRILIAGSSGFLGSALLPALREAGHEVTRLVRSDSCLIEDCLRWEPARGTLETEQLEGYEAVITLGGINLTAKRWTRNFKQSIADSRIESNALLANSLASLTNRPRLWLAASAIGYYGLNSQTPVDETSPPGDDFLAQLCLGWEAACQPAAEAGIKVIYLRTGTVLSPLGGALKKMLPPFRLGLGGRFGSGRQPMNWISITDWISAILHLLDSQQLNGPVNLVSPDIISNLKFTQQLARHLERPAIMALPAWLLRLILGEMAQYLLLSGVTIRPQQLLHSGFQFKHQTIAGYLPELIDR